MEAGYITCTTPPVTKSVMPLCIIFDNIFIRFGTKLYRQTICVPMGTNCAPLVEDFSFLL